MRQKNNIAGKKPVSTIAQNTFAFGRFALDIDRGALTSDGKDIKLRPKSFQVLQYLLERHGRLVSKEEILGAIWGSTVVTDDAVTQCLIDVRKAIGDRSQQMIRTIPRRGYLFDVPVTRGDRHAIGAATNRSLLSSLFRRRNGVAFLLAFGIALVSWGIAERFISGVADPDRGSLPASYSIAVLPFLDLSPDQDLGYFGDGISEEILNLLAQAKGLRVIARTSSFAFRGGSLDISTIREKLDVTHVLEGSVRQSEDAIRVTAQLVDAVTSEHVWSETYDRKLDRLFDIQDEIAADVLKRLAVSLNISIPNERNTNIEAYRLYLQAVHIIDQLDFSKNAEAESILRSVLEMDPNFAPAWRELARILWRQIGDGPNIEADIARTREALEKAFEIAPDDAATLAYLGWHFADFDGDIRKGARMFERALSNEPFNENVFRTAMLFAGAFGQPADAVRLGELGISRNPICFPCYVQLAVAYRNADRLDDAARVWRTIQTLFRRNGGLGWVLLLKGQPEQALAVFSAGQPESQSPLGKVLSLYSLGRLDDYENAMAQFLESTANKSTWNIAIAYTWTEQYDAAFKAIDRAAREEQLYVDGRIVRWNPARISGIARHLIFRGLHDDPRWNEFLEKYGVSEKRIAEAGFSVNIPD